MLARDRLTSAIELYDRKGTPVSRFALNLPEYASGSHKASGCDWDVVDETSPFGSSQRHVLRASRGGRGVIPALPARGRMVAWS